VCTSGRKNWGFDFERGKTIIVESNG